MGSFILGSGQSMSLAREGFPERVRCPTIFNLFDKLIYTFTKWKIIFIEKEIWKEHIIL